MVELNVYIVERINMSTKYSENCSHCHTSVSPTDTAVAVDTRWGTIPVKVWRYVCACGHVWANEAQRKHNDHEYHKAKRKQKEQMWV